MTKKLLLIVILCFTALGAVLAQNRTLNGKVTDQETGQGLPGVNVFLKGTTTGTVTDVNGNYSIQVSEGAVLVFQAVGLATQEIVVGTQTSLDVSMAQDVTELGEVVVTGYQSFTKERSNISAVTINSELIELRPNPSFIQTLSGQVPGLSITTGTGQPGGNSLVNLRGVGSINGDTEPLFIIDGAPVDQDNFRSLNPNEIASVSVLKDAGATAIYGNRGANGVIVIETKRGRLNSPLEVTYSYQISSSTLQRNKYDLMSSPEQLRIEKLYGNGRGVDLTDAEINATPTFDWADWFFNQGIAHNHNLQFRTGGAKSTAFVSLGYLDQEGILQDSDLQRFNLRTNVTGKSENNKFNYGLNLSVNYSENDEPNSIGTGGINQNYVLGAYQSVPYITPDDYVDGESLLSPLSFANTPLFLIDRLRTHYRTIDELKIIGTISFSYEIIDGLTAGFRVSGDFQNISTLFSQAPNSFNALLFAQTGNNTPGIQDQQNTREFLYNQVSNLNYTKTFGKHTINVGTYIEYFRASRYTFGFRQEGLNLKTFSPGDGSAFVGDNAENDFFVDVANADKLRSGLFSYFGQADYDFDSRFGFTGTLRRDASSKFSGSNRWGTFYSVAGRWNIHNEIFAENLPFDILKLRASYGSTGNQDITGLGYFSALDLYRPLFATGNGYGAANAIFLSQLENTTLKWETIAQGSIGIDAELFDSRLRTTVEGYIKTTTDLFISTPISSINSATSINANAGKLQNRGIDLSIAYDIFRSEQTGGFNLTLSLVGNYNKQEILEFPAGEQEIVTIGRVGGSLFEYFDYRYAGVNPSNGNLLFFNASGEVTENPNVDTDRVWLEKNIYPEYQGGISLNADYKGFFLTVQFNYAIGVDRFDFDLSGFQDPTNIGQFRSSRDLLRAWTPESPVTDIPSLTAANIDLGGDRYISDASYLRLRFASVGYNVPQKYLDKIGLRVGRVFFNGENLLTFSKWRGFDPEALDNTSRIYPTPRTWSFGVEIGI